MTAPNDALRADYDALLGAGGYCSLPNWTLVELTGNDRVAFLQGLCTNDIKKLNPGKGCEAFLTNVQGKIIGHLLVHSTEDALLLDSVPGQAADIVAALDKYLIREKVHFANLSETLPTILVCGSELPATLDGMFQTSLPIDPLPVSLANRTVPWNRSAVTLRTISWGQSPSLLLSASPETLSEVQKKLTAEGIKQVNPAAADLLRIEAGTPLFGQDFGGSNLPQELDRDARTVSFTKGCYLGQETVARIDALGHVNQLLRGLKFSSPSVPPIGTELRQGEKSVGKVTSAAWSFLHEAPFALALIRRGSNRPDTELSSEAGDVVVTSLPGA